MALPTYQNVGLTDTFGSWKDKTNALAADAESLHSLNVKLSGAQTIAGVKTFSDTVAVANSGINFGADVNLYRQSANLLKTDDALQSASIATGAVSAGAISGSSTLSVVGAASIGSLSVSGASALVSVTATSISCSSVNSSGAISCASVNSSGSITGTTLSCSGSVTSLSVITDTVTTTSIAADSLNADTRITAQEIIVNDSIQSAGTMRIGGGSGVPLDTIDIRAGGIRFSDGSTQTSSARPIYFYSPAAVTAPASPVGPKLISVANITNDNSSLLVSVKCTIKHSENSGSSVIRLLRSSVPTGTGGTGVYISSLALRGGTSLVTADAPITFAVVDSPGPGVWYYKLTYTGGPSFASVVVYTLTEIAKV